MRTLSRFFISSYMVILGLSATAYAQNYVHLTKDSKASELTYSSSDYVQFMGPNLTLTVDTDMTVKDIIFGSRSADVSPSNVVIEAGNTLTASSPYGNVGRPETIINISGAGNLVYTSKTLKFYEQTSQAAQYYNYNISGTFSIASKNIIVQNKNYVSLGNVSGGFSGVDMSGDSSLSMNISTSYGGADISLTGSSYLEINDVKKAYGISTVFNVSDGSHFNMNCNSFTIMGNSTIGNVSEVSHLGVTVYLEDGSNVVINAGTNMLTFDSHIILKTCTLTLNTSTPFLRKNGSLAGLQVARTSRLILNADQNFGAINLYRAEGNSDVFSIELNSSKVDITSMSVTSSTSKVIFEDFAEGLVHVDSELATNEDGSLQRIYALVDSAEVKLYQLDNGYLSLTIPEPAELVAIFGAVALGLAAYRRRRK